MCGSGYPGLIRVRRAVPQPACRTPHACTAHVSPPVPPIACLCVSFQYIKACKSPSASTPHDSRGTHILSTLFTQATRGACSNDTSLSSRLRSRASYSRDSLEAIPERWDSPCSCRRVRNVQAGCIRKRQTKGLVRTRSAEIPRYRSLAASCG